MEATWKLNIRSFPLAAFFLARSSWLAQDTLKSVKGCIYANLNSEPKPKAIQNSAQVRYSKPHVYIAFVVEVAYDPAQSLKRGKSTDQGIIVSEGVRITALLLKLSTKQNIQLGSAVRDWAPDLELDPRRFSQVSRFLCQLRSIKTPKNQTSAFTMALPYAICFPKEKPNAPMTPGSEVESKSASGDAPLAPEMPPPATQSESAQGGVAPPDERRSGDHPDISAEAWLGPAGSLGPRRRDSTLPKSNFSQEVCCFEVAPAPQAASITWRHPRNRKVFPKRPL